MNLTLEDFKQFAEDEWLGIFGEPDKEEWNWHWFYLMLGYSI